MAQQVLLGLSPLHHCVLPAPETAGLCPSSFKPAVGKLLQLKLLSRPVLDAFQHQHQTDTTITTTTIATSSSSSSSSSSNCCLLLFALHRPAVASAYGQLSANSQGRAGCCSAPLKATQSLHE